MPLKCCCVHTYHVHSAIKCMRIHEPQTRVLEKLHVATIVHVTVVVIRTDLSRGLCRTERGSVDGTSRRTSPVESRQRRVHGRSTTLCSVSVAKCVAIQNGGRDQSCGSGQIFTYLYFLGVLGVTLWRKSEGELPWDRGCV